MILDAIILENFGAYGGRQEATLTPKADKPIVLFGGLNGGGKTTLLDAIQLAFYGDKARISNRGRRPYKDYLLQSIHRGSELSEGAGVIVRFRRIVEGETRNFELSRTWRQGVKGIEETIRVLRDGKPDDVFTEHWNEVIEAYLPSSIAHLFFFDGEQIMELAEGGHAAEILGTAIHSLLGLDIVDRLETDLKVFERRKRAEGLDQVANDELARLKIEIDHLDAEQQKIAIEEGTLVNVAGRAAKDALVQEEAFRVEGGELFEQRASMEAELAELKVRKARFDSELRELASGPLPLLMLESLLSKVEKLVRHEHDVRVAKTLIDVLEHRDREILVALAKDSIQAKAVACIESALAKDRRKRLGLANEALLLDAPDELAPQITHLRATLLPTSEEQARHLILEIARLQEQIARLDEKLERVPTADRIALAQAKLREQRRVHSEKLSELEEIRMRKEILRKQREEAEKRLDRIGARDADAQFETDDRQRMLKHSQKARGTLNSFRTQIVRKHAKNMEGLMLESFRKLLRKTELIKGLSINPETFEATLTGRDGKPLPFDRLSAGERQLLATSILWGLARASGRAIPTVIDTPLGRLDSDHRTNLIERYFPNASHQVLLLSTDEEIIDGYFQKLRPHVARTYRLEHDEKRGFSSIREGYF